MGLHWAGGVIVLVAVTDHKDIGTIFECGVAYLATTPIIYYAETLGNKPFNLMLAESGVAIVRSPEELLTLIVQLRSKDDLRKLADGAHYGGPVE